MSDKALSNAEAKKNQLVEKKRRLLAELTDVDDQIGQVDRFIKAWHAFAEDESESTVDKLLEQRTNKEGSSENVRKKATKNSRKEAVAEAAREIILQLGRPAARKELFDQLIARGLTIEGADPEMVLSTMLWRMKDRIQRVEGGGYWIAETNPPKPETAPSAGDNSNLF